MEIELATVAHAERVTDLWVDLADEQTQHDSHVLAERNRSSVADELARHAVTDRLVVATDGEIVGFVMFTLDRGSYEMDVTQGVVENLYVVPERREEGIGAELLATAEARLDELGADTVTLEAMADNLAARRFYRRHGYDTHRVQLEKPLETDTHSKEGE
ncbi:GNAT family N-acetyltransferase [Halosimplex pelagicum]|uniref:GNAT family N-acetyltransferase n=1 Tax=Halosimplex pelagicum TaxID=869886 RepID=A0A7D5P8U0_9EURY|nr:GNAT family N-acetyltransferase [Halosimplex pelagicum]QLH83603.1 GNAT family N-acetyltransferase [Halosimplex pelagicum]